MKESTKQVWLNRYRSKSPRRFVIWLVLFTLLCLTVGYGWATLSDKAFGAETTAVVPAQVQDDDTDQAQRCCSALARKYARKFRRGEMGRDSGFRPGRWFVNPKVARRIWIRKIARYLENHPNKWPRRREQYQARSCYPASTCYATDLYSKSRESATCVAGSPYPANQDACKKGMNINSRGMTKEMLQKFGAVVLCGGAVAIGAVTSTASGGTTAFVAVWGATSCAWSFWMGF